jgi:molybdopterin converting factor small subunit
MFDFWTDTESGRIINEIGERVNIQESTKMFKTKMPMYGLYSGITDLRDVELELRNGAGMAEVVAEMRKKIPSLEGPVIRQGEDRLVDLYKFNINGHFFFDGMDFELQPGDRIALLVPAMGG